MTEQEISEAHDKYYSYLEEIDKHNIEMLESLKGFKREDFEEILDCASVTAKMSWVGCPDFVPEDDPDEYGIFKLTHVDQRQVGLEGDSFAGEFYIKVEGYPQWLKVPYEC